MREIWELIPREYRRGVVRVAAMVPVKAILDLVGVAALVPVIMLVLDPVRLDASFVGRLCSQMGFSGNLSRFVIVAVVAVLILKILLSLLIIRNQSRFLMSLYRNLSSRLFVSLYSRGLLYIKNQNSYKMTFNITGVCYNFVMGYLGGWMKLFGEIAFVLLMFVALMAYSVKATVMALVAFIPVVCLYVLFVRRPLRQMSTKENNARREQSRLINEAFKGYSEVQVNDAFPMIQRRFNEGLENISSYRIRSGVIQSIPSYLLELSVVMIVAAMTLFSMDAANSQNMVFLGIFAVALLKLLPAIKGIIGAMTALSATRYTREVIVDIKTPATFRLIHDDRIEPLAFRNRISVENVSFRFEDEDTPVISGLDFEIEKGCRFGIKGRTGAGKTTLFNLLLGLYPPTEGRICVDGVPVTAENAASWHKIIGYVPQDVFISDTTILGNVALGYDESQIDREKAMKALERASLMDFVNSLPDGVDTRIGEAGSRISGGQRQRIGIARALYKDATVLFFDEATSSLDNQTEREVNDAIETLSDNDRNLTVIIISHRDSTLVFCDRILRL